MFPPNTKIGFTFLLARECIVIIHWIRITTIGWRKSNHPTFFCCYFFVIKNFSSVCDISLFNPFIRIYTIKSRKWYRPSGCRQSWWPYGPVLWHFPELRATVSRIPGEFSPWGLQESDTCWRKLATSKNPIKGSLERLNRVIWTAETRD